MNALYLIGNGFDINAGLDTSARSIISRYRNELKERDELAKANDEVFPKGLHAFLESLEEEFDTWGSFEMKLGEITSKFDIRQRNNSPSDKDYLIAFNDFREFLYKHIESQETVVGGYSFSKEQLETFRRGAFAFLRDGMREEMQTVLDAYTHNHQGEVWTADFLTFNYTSLTHRLIKSYRDQNLPINFKINGVTRTRKLGLVRDIHGQISDNHGIIVGVDSAAQIMNAELANLESITSSLVKPAVSERTGDLKPQHALEMIDDAQIICVYGMSLGKSDITWWKALGTWLRSNAESKLLILDIHDTPDTRFRAELYATERDRQINSFLKLAGIETEEQAVLRDRILISFGSHCFDLGL